ncbi:MAG: DUF1273 family protein [Clostridia bacterium]|nr:DUF1273 family protein [Clostridia bacterium]
MSPPRLDSDPQRSVCFTGHRTQHIRISLNVLWERCRDVVNALYAAGRRDFLCGGATGFDTLAASCVLQAREHCPGMRLILALPCADQTRGWPEHERALYDSLAEQADRVLILAHHYYPGCMMVRNRFLVDHAGFCVAYLDGHKGGTSGTVRFALQSGLPVLNLAVESEVRRFLRENADEALPF